MARKKKKKKITGHFLLEKNICDYILFQRLYSDIAVLWKKLTGWYGVWEYAGSS